MVSKRQGDPSEADSSPKKRKTKLTKVHHTRWRELRRCEVEKAGPVVYLCSRDQRVRDNWALLHACDLSSKHDKPVVVLFDVTDEDLSMGERHSLFMLKGLQEMEQSLQELGIPFYLVQGKPEEEVPKMLGALEASILVTDMNPLRGGRKWRDDIAETIDIPFHEVDAHNVVPIWITSNKQEYAARTIRSKIHRNIPSYLREFPKIEMQNQEAKAADLLSSLPKPKTIDWEGLMAVAREKGSEVPEVTWCKPGERAALEALKGKDESFLTKRRMGKYDELRNNPNIPGALSNLSPYLHFGQIAAQRCAIEAIAFKKANPSASKSVDNYLEELVVRRELSDNFCFYNALYDHLTGAASWAQESLIAHKKDKREYLYTKEQLELGKTHDNLWNAAQMEMVKFGKMHGFMRMYWAKKILEWTESPEQALSIALYLNDKYQLDGRDPNGYVGCMWSICGIHDQGWRERSVFGKIRYMNYAGCKRKFDVDAYVQRVRRESKFNRYFNEKA